MPKVSEAYLEERRQQILEAAIACFAEKGFHQTTMEDIGRKAGLSPGVAYRYFGGKEDIVVATVQAGVDRSTHLLEEVAEQGDVFAVLEKMIDGHFGRFLQPGRDVYYRARVQLWAEAIRNPRVADELRSRRRLALEQLTAVIAAGQERGQITADLDARAATTAIVASLDGFVLQWLADPELDVGHCRDALTRMVRGLFDDRSPGKEGL